MVEASDEATKPGGAVALKWLPLELGPIKPQPGTRCPPTQQHGEPQSTGLFHQVFKAVVAPELYLGPRV